MSEAENFLAAIIREPANGINWLVYADWLEEQGGTETLAKAWSGKPPQRTSMFSLYAINGKTLNYAAKEHGITFDFSNCPAPGEKMQAEIQKRYCTKHNIPTGPSGVGDAHVR